VSSLLLFHAILLAGSGAALSLISLSDFPGPRQRGQLLIVRNVCRER